VRATDLAAVEAVRRSVPLRIVFAVPDLDEARPILTAAAARVRARHPDLPVTAEAVRGSALKALTRESGDAGLTVVGTRGCAGPAGILLGSVSPRLAAHAHGPLLVVRGDRRRGDGGEVLLGLADEADAVAAAHAFQEAARRGARLRVLHSSNRRHAVPEPPPPPPVTPPGRPGPTPRDTAEDSPPRRTVARFQQQYPAVGTDLRTVRTDPAHALLEATRAADVVVIGSRRRTRRAGSHPGPVARTLLRRSHCPVLVVPTG